MSLVDFRFDNLTRTQYDNSTFTQDNIMNTNLANYTLFNPFSKNCNGGLNFATQQPNVFVPSNIYLLSLLTCVFGIVMSIL